MSECVDHGRTGTYANVYSAKHGKSIGLHRLVLADKLGVDVLELDGVVMHSCDNKRCVNPMHLSLATQLQNGTDAYKRGWMTILSGASHPATKLTDEQMDIVMSSTKGARTLGRELGVSHSIISRIRNGKGRAAQ